MKDNYYSNILLFHKEGHALAVIGEKRARWYLDRDLAESIHVRPPFEEGIKLKFDSGGKSRGGIIEYVLNRCVCCGGENDLEIHHVIPHVVKKVLDISQKGNTSRWCVLVCVGCHRKAEDLLEEVYRRDLDNLMQAVHSYDRGSIESIKEGWAKQFILENGGFEGIKELFKGKFLDLNPLFLPETFLK